jgi:C4-type Zn-finger protein
MKTYTRQEIEEMLTTGKTPEELLELARQQEELEAQKITKRNEAIIKIREFLVEVEKGAYDDSDIASSIFRQIGSDIYTLQDLQKEEEDTLNEE